MVDDGHAEAPLGPQQRVGVATLAREEQRAEAAQVVPEHVRAVGVFALDRPERRRGREQDVHPVLRGHAPERAGIGRAGRLPFVEDGRVPVDQRAVHDVGVADDPADVGRRPEDLSRLRAVHVLHAPLQGDRVPSVVAHDAFGNARGAGRVEDVERVGRGEGNARRRPRVRHELRPLDIAPGDHVRVLLRPLDDDAPIRLRRGDRDRLIEQRLVRYDAARLEPARGADDQLRLRVVDPSSQLVRSKPPNTTEWMAPMRAQASMAITASGTMGM